MSIRKVSFTLDEYYHIYNRGNSKQEIFHDKEDYFRFLSLLYACNSQNNFKTDNINRNKTPYDFERGKSIISIGAYCLMQNHFHILVREIESGGISKFMQKASTAYSMYYNKKYKRTGGLFEGKFKSQHANTDRYLKYLFSYIHLNPIKNVDKNWKENGVKNPSKITEYLNKYEYSSYLDWFGMKRVQKIILSAKNFPDYFSTKKVFVKEVFDWVNYK